jgi:nucleoside-diphosphate-sugar epimerase
MILITGGTGMVGAHLLLHLTKSEIPVRAIYRNKKRIQRTKHLFDLCEHADLFYKIEWVKADITDIPALENAFEGIDFVYHCAAVISFNAKDTSALRKANIEGTANMINLSIDFGIKKFCYVSSIAALGETLSHDRIISEKSDWNPELFHSDYAISKYGGEMEVWRGTQEGLKVIVVNPGVIFGKGFGFEGSGEFFAKALKNFPFYTNGTTGVVSASDVVKVMISLMDSNIENERFTLVSENLPYRRIMNFCAQLLNKRQPHIYASPFSCSLAWRLDRAISACTGKKRSFTRAMAKASHSNYIYSNTKIKETIGFEFESHQVFLPKVLSSLSLL